MSVKRVIEGQSVEIINPFRPESWQLPPLRDKSLSLLLTGSAGGGKALALDTEVPTLQGWKKMGEIQIGDTVFSAKGHPVQVVALSPIMENRPCYEVTFSTGETVIADADHQWVVRTPVERSHRLVRRVQGKKRKVGEIDRSPIIRNTAEMAQNVHSGKHLTYSVDLAMAFEYKPQPVPVSPYVMGFLLGDGYLRDLSFTTAESEIVSYIQQEMGDDYKVVKGSGDYTYHIQANGFTPLKPTTAKPARVYKHHLVDRYVAMMRKAGGGEDYLGIFPTKEAAWEVINQHDLQQCFSQDEKQGVGIWNAFNQLNLRDCRSSTKFIPDVYKYNSIEVRLETLRGLMDSDGHIDPKRGRCEFMSISKQLALDVLEILSSLGVKATLNMKRATLKGKDFGEAYRIHFTAGLPVFRLSRKAQHIKTNFRPTQERRYITGITPVNSVSVRCIQVEGDGTFLITRGCIPTHNSRIAAEKLHMYCLKYGGATAVMLRKTAESCTNSIVAFTKNVVIGNDPRVRPHLSARRFEYDNGSVLVWGGMKDTTQREQIRSLGQDAGIDILWLEEATAFVEDDYNELLARLRGKAGSFRQIILTTNPGAPSHWIHQRLMKNGEAKVYYSSALDNPYNPPEYLSILQNLKGLLYQRLVLGQWVQAEGAVYSEFDPALHIVDTLPNAFKRYVVGVDWGYTNPGVMLVFGVDGDGRLTLVEEVYRTKELVAGVDGKDGFWVKEARRIKKRYGNPRFWCDPSEPAYIETLKQAGIQAAKADNDIRSGIDKIKTRLNPAWDGLPRLYFWRYANSNPDLSLQAAKLPTGIIDEFAAYVYAKGSDGKPNKEVPVDYANHGLDAARYVCAAEDAPQGVYVRRL